jgi:hypothetical protein
MEGTMKGQFGSTWWESGQRVAAPLVRLLAAGGLVAGLLAASPAAAGPEKEQRSMRRQIALLEKAIDAALVASPNIRVSGSANAGGLYLPGYGVIFSAGGSLMMDGGLGDLAKKFMVQGEKFKVQIGGDDDDSSSGNKADDKADDKSDDRTRERRAKRELERRAKRIDALKQEIIDVLGDYGPALTALAPNDKVGVALFVTKDLFGDSWDRVILLEVTRADLDRYDGEQISEEELARRVKITEN